MCILCEKTYGMLTNLADHMTNNHSFIHSGEIKKDLKISEEQQGKKIEKRIFSFTLESHKLGQINLYLEFGLKNYFISRGKSLLKSWVTTFLPD